VPLWRETITPEARVNDLLGLARTLRDRGDTSTALTRLREAQVISPTNVQIISEMAATYEKMGLNEKAIEQWRRIYELGEQAGIYYAAAEAKLRALELPEATPTPTPVPVTDSLVQTGGLLPDGSPQLASPTMLLGAVGTIDDTGNSQPRRELTLRVPILAKKGVQVDVHDVVIQVFFYDQAEDGTIVETDANVSSKWNSSPVDWSTPDPELLDVSYSQPEADPKDPRSREHRIYFGYVVRLYYKGDLNAARAEPVKLLKLFPPPLTLQPQSDLPQ